MNLTVFFTVLSGVITFVIGQLLVKLVIDPVQELKKTIGQISHSMIEHANVIANPGVPNADVMKETSKHLRQLSSQLHGHLYLVPLYKATAWFFRLPTKERILVSSGAVIGLSNSVFRASPSEHIDEHNAKRVELICDSLGIYMAEGDRIPKDLT